MTEAAEISGRYLQGMSGSVPLAVALVAAGAIAMRSSAPRLRMWVLVATTAFGAWAAIQHLSLVDDAFISFRYADRLLAGKGLTFNDGEAVLGITNVGWTLAVAGVSALTPLDIPQAALLLGGVAWVALLLGTEQLARSYSERPALPAVAMVATQFAVVTFASTGLETLASAACVTWGYATLLRARDAPAAGRAGLILALGGFVRFDHLIFHTVGALALRPRWWAAYFAPTLLFEAFAAWMVWRYGDPIPNVWYAATPFGTRLGQGALVLGSFWLSAGLLLWLPLAAAGLSWKKLPEATSLTRLAVPALVVWHLYILASGGDIIFGRSLVVCLPFVAVAAERGLVALSARGFGPLAGAAFGLGLLSIPVVAPKDLSQTLVDEGSFYPVTSVFPVRIGHHAFVTGTQLYDLFANRGLRVTLATHSSGLVGFYSKAEVIDTLGTTDRTVARSTAGSSNSAPRSYLRAREVQISRQPPFANREGVTRIRLPTLPESPLNDWHLYRYDPDFVETVRLWVPELKLPDGVAWVRRQRARLADMPPAEAADLLRFLDGWYFPDNPDPALREEVQLRAAATSPPTPPH